MCHTGGRGIKTTTKQTTSCYWHMYNRAGITSKAEARVCSSWVIPAGRLHSWAAAEAAWVHVVCTSASRFPGSASRQTWWTCSRRSRDCHSHRQVVAGADHRPCSQCRGSLAVNALQGPATHTHTFITAIQQRGTTSALCQQPISGSMKHVKNLLQLNFTAMLTSKTGSQSW